MRIFDSVLPRIHATVKRSPRGRRVAVWLVHAATGAWGRARHPLRPRYGPPLGVATATSSGRSDDPASRTAATWYEVRPHRRIQRRLPETLDDAVHWKFERHRERGWTRSQVAVIPGGRVWGPGTAAITADNQLLGDLSKAPAETEDYLADPAAHPVFAEPDLGSPLDLRGTAAVLSAPCGGGYYHWLIDVLPRLELLRRAGHGHESLDHLIVNACSAGYQRETLERLEVPRAKLIESRWHPHIQAERLIFPSLPGPFGHVPRWACDFVRRAFLEENATRDADSGARLYLNRARVTHRRVVNENALIERLEARGFRDVTLDHLSVGEQARLLSTARIIVAPHGAALTNLLFCRPGTWVVELMSPRDVSHVYWTLADTMELNYAYVIGEGAQPPAGVDPHDGEIDLHVSPDAVEKMLDRIQSPRRGRGQTTRRASTPAGTGRAKPDPSRLERV